MALRASPKCRDILSMQNWVENTGCLSRAETAYLWKEDDLILGGYAADDTERTLEGPIEDAIIRFRKFLRMVRINPVYFFLYVCGKLFFFLAFFKSYAIC